MLAWIKSLFTGDKLDGPLARRGENLAARFIAGLGYKILARNYRSAVGEIDIVARDRDTLVFVEVKTRADDDPRPEDQVNRGKQHRLTRAAKSYLARYGSPPPGARFDVVAIVWADGKEPVIRHTQHAFEATF